MYGIIGALFLLIVGTADYFNTKSKGRKSAEKFQKHFDELERVRKEGEEKMNRSIDRMMREDAKRSLR